jgi:hypothetical protein
MDKIDAEWFDIWFCIQPNGPATWDDWIDLGPCEA